MNRLKEIESNPICLGCGSIFNYRKCDYKDTIYHKYSCDKCGNNFNTIKTLLCPICFKDLCVYKEERHRIYLCSNLHGLSYISGERLVFKTIGNSEFKNPLQWEKNKNYFLFYSMVKDISNS